MKVQIRTTTFFHHAAQLSYVNSPSHIPRLSLGLISWLTTFWLPKIKKQPVFIHKIDFHDLKFWPRFLPHINASISHIIDYSPVDTTERIILIALEEGIWSDLSLFFHLQISPKTGSVERILLEEKEHLSHIQVLLSLSFFSLGHYISFTEGFQIQALLWVFQATAWLSVSLVKPFPFLQVLHSGHYRLFLAIVCLQNHIGEKK